MKQLILPAPKSNDNQKLESSCNIKGACCGGPVQSSDERVASLFGGFGDEKLSTEEKMDAKFYRGEIDLDDFNENLQVDRRGYSVYMGARYNWYLLVQEHPHIGDKPFIVRQGHR